MAKSDSEEILVPKAGCGNSPKKLLSRFCIFFAVGLLALATQALAADASKHPKLKAVWFPKGKGMLSDSSGFSAKQDDSRAILNNWTSHKIQLFQE